ENLAFGQEDGNRSQGPQLSRPVILVLGGGRSGRGSFQPTRMSADPVRLRGLLRQQVESPQPMLPRLRQLSFVFARSGRCSQMFEFVGVHQRVTVLAD